MKYIKILGLLAVAAVALMAFAGTAAATSVTETTGGAAATPTIHAVNEGGHVTLANPIANISCSSTVEGAVESHGTGVAASGNISKLEFTGCTNSWHVTAVAGSLGSLSVNWTSGHNGTLTSTGSKVDTTRLGVTCVYQTNNTSIGTVTGGNPATLKIEASIPLVESESSGLCGSGNAKWEGNYVSTSALYVSGEGGGGGVLGYNITTATFGKNQTKTLSVDNTGSVEWKIVKDSLTSDSGSWSWTGGIQCSPQTVSPGSSCSRSDVSCGNATGTVTWTIKVEKLDGTLSVEETKPIKCD